jgi:hypothetical protein
MRVTLVSNARTSSVQAPSKSSTVRTAPVEPSPRTWFGRIHGRLPCAFSSVVRHDAGFRYSALTDAHSIQEATMRSRLALVQVPIILPLLLLGAAVDAAANHDMTCHPPGGSNVFAVWITVGFFNPVGDTSSARLFVDVGRAPEGTHAVVDDGTSTAVFSTETGGSASVACADADGDGVAGITAVNLTLTSRRHDSRAAVSIVIVPAKSAEVDQSGWHAVRAEVSDGLSIVRMEGQALAVATSRGMLR